MHNVCLVTAAAIHITLKPLTLAQVSGSRNFQNTTDQSNHTIVLWKFLVPETWMNLIQIFNAKKTRANFWYHIFEHVSLPI